MYGKMSLLCCVPAGKTGQLNPINIEEQKGGLKTLAEKGMSSSKMQHNLLCQNKRLQKSLFPCSAKPRRHTSPPNHFARDKRNYFSACHFFLPIRNAGEDQEE